MQWELIVLLVMMIPKVVMLGFNALLTNQKVSMSSEGSLAGFIALLYFTVQVLLLLSIGGYPVL